MIVYYGIIWETLGPGGARVAFVNTTEETASAIFSCRSADPYGSGRIEAPFNKKNVLKI